MRVNSLVCEDTGVMSAYYITGENTMEHDIVVPSKTSTVQIIEQTSLQAATPFEDILF